MLLLKAHKIRSYVHMATQNLSLVLRTYIILPYREIYLTGLWIVVEES